MPAGRPRKVRSCKRCEESELDGVELSVKGLCGACARAAVEANVRELATKSGPGYQRWAEGIIRAAQEALETAETG